MKKIDYQLQPATEEDLERIQKEKLESILEYAQDLDQKEKEKIEKYVKETLPKQIPNYQIITTSHKKIGCLLVEPKEDAALLDEIYLEKEYRGKNIGTTIIQNLIESYPKIILWVYKENVRALKLYHKLGFQVEEETQTRYLMSRSKNDNKKESSH